MRGIKIPLQDFVLKMQGGLMREGGRICGTLRYMLGLMKVYDKLIQIIHVSGSFRTAGNFTHVYVREFFFFYIVTTPQVERNHA